MPLPDDHLGRAVAEEERMRAQQQRVMYQITVFLKPVVVLGPGEKSSDFEGVPQGPVRVDWLSYSIPGMYNDPPQLVIHPHDGPKVKVYNWDNVLSVEYAEVSGSVIS